MSEYSLKVGEAVLRSRTRAAEQSARVEAEIANRIKSEFISNMSHELRTPLNTVIGFSKLLAESDRRTLPNDDVTEYARLIHDASRNLLAIINDILEISKIQSGHFNLNLVDASLTEVIELILSASKKMASEAGVTINLLSADASGNVKGDPSKLRQIFTNLIGNAIKFTEAGGSVTVDVKSDDDGATTVQIADTGVGMTDEEVGVALAPFGQVDGARTRWREGTGLGLPIAKALVELHGGRIHIQSRKGVGTVVTVAFPPPELIEFIQNDHSIQVVRGS